MKHRKYVVDSSGLTVRLPFSTATIGWKSLAIILAFIVLLAAVFVFVTIVAVRLIAVITVVGLVVYAWSRIRKFGRGGLPPGAGSANLRPTPTPTKVGGAEREFPED